MNCYECDGTYREKSDVLELVDPYVGSISVPDVPYYQCDKCGGILYTTEMSRALETQRHNRARELLNQLPLGDFISAAETASILGFSRQALHKNRRIRHGFIHQTAFAGATVYLRQSVVRFKKTGDGRFSLYPSEHSPSAEYLKDTVPLRTLPHYDPHATTINWQPQQFKGVYSGSMEKRYAN